MIVTYPNLRVGDFLPVFGSLYRVDKIVDQGPPKGREGKDWMSMSLAETKSLPRGLTFKEGSIAIPLARGIHFEPAYGVIVDVSAKADAVQAGPGDGRGQIVEITMREYGPPPAGSRAGNSFVTKTTAMKLHTGDALTIGKCAFKVQNIVPRDEKRHIIGWIELESEPAPEPAAVPHDKGAAKSTERDVVSTVPPRRAIQTFPAIIKEMVADAEIGADPAFDKLAKEQGLRAGATLPSELRKFLASWTGCSIERANVSFGLRSGEANFAWNCYLVLPDEPHGAKAGITRRLMREAIAGPQTQPLSAYLRDMTQKCAATGAAPIEPLGPFLRITRHTVEEPAFLEGVAQRPGDGKWSARLDWNVMGYYRGEAPTFAELLNTCPWLKSPALENPFFEKVRDCPVFAYNVKLGPRFSDWMVEVPESATRGLESLLKEKGFVAREKAIKLKPPFWPPETEQHTWYRGSDWTSASLIPLPSRKRAQFIFQSPQKPSAENLNLGRGL